MMMSNAISINRLCIPTFRESPVSIGLRNGVMRTERSISTAIQDIIRLLWRDTNPVLNQTNSLFGFTRDGAAA